MLVKSWVFCAALLLLVSNSLRAEADLNGVAAYSELGNELFMAALFAGQTGTNAQELINGSYPKRMELKILAKQGITQRQFSRIWRESVAINNTRDALIAQAENMVYFEELVRDRLESNDHLVIAYAPMTGVDVSLNSVVLGHVGDDAFFTLLLRSWIGSVPSSTAFRDDLLKANTADTALVNRFNAMYPRNARIEVAKSWLPVVAPPQKELDEPESPVALATPAAAPVATAVTEPKILTAEKPAVAKPEVSPPVPVALKTASPIPESTPTVSAAEQNPVLATANPEPGLSKAQALLAKQFYMADVFKKINTHVDYPRRAQQLRQIGTVRLSVVIDAAGQLKTVAPIEELEFVMLNKAALAAVRSAAPFAPLPAGLEVAELELSVPITFAMGEL
ncbi:TonB family protein [Cellvibrio sp. UBA7671]|uniref:TonB family protein n=1 Tax=Cellvibrio sp. UBA7671 TaxID=1946312 RepID=UPI002F350031